MIFIFVVFSSVATHLDMERCQKLLPVRVNIINLRGKKQMVLIEVYFNFFNFFLSFSNTNKTKFSPYK